VGTVESPGHGHIKSLLGLIIITQYHWLLARILSSFREPGHWQPQTQVTVTVAGRGH